MDVDGDFEGVFDGDLLGFDDIGDADGDLVGACVGPGQVKSYTDPADWNGAPIKAQVAYEFNATE